MNVPKLFSFLICKVLATLDERKEEPKIFELFAAIVLFLAIVLISLKFVNDI
jgi:hypothetical protein